MPYNITMVMSVTPGQNHASTPNTIATIPRSNSTHQLRESNTSSDVFIISLCRLRMQKPQPSPHERSTSFFKCRSVPGANRCSLVLTLDSHGLGHALCSGQCPPALRCLPLDLGPIASTNEATGRLCSAESKRFSSRFRPSQQGGSLRLSGGSQLILILDG